MKIQLYFVGKMKNSPEKDIFDKCYSEADIFRDKLSKFDKRRYYKSEISNRLKLWVI